jgi:hypothetical protein
VTALPAFQDLADHPDAINRRAAGRGPTPDASARRCAGIVAESEAACSAMRRAEQETDRDATEADVRQAR